MNRIHSVLLLLFGYKNRLLSPRFRDCLRLPALPVFLPKAPACPLTISFFAFLSAKTVKRYKKSADPGKDRQPILYSVRSFRPLSRPTAQKRAAWQKRSSALPFLFGGLAENLFKNSIFSPLANFTGHFPAHLPVCRLILFSSASIRFAVSFAFLSNSAAGAIRKKKRCKVRNRLCSVGLCSCLFCSCFVEAAFQKAERSVSFSVSFSASLSSFFLEFSGFFSARDEASAISDGYFFA